MERIKLAICMSDGEYLHRFFGCLINHYRSQLEIAMFTDREQIAAVDVTIYDVFLVSDFELSDDEIQRLPQDKLLYLSEENKEYPLAQEVLVVDKYSSVPDIVDAIGIRIGNKERIIVSNALETEHHMLGIYSLNAAEMQLPFIIMLANILSEKYRVLVVDLQENSGLSGLEEGNHTSGLEDLLVIADSGKYSKARLISAIGHYRQWDYIYPVRNSECLCEADYELYHSLLSMMIKEFGYDYVLINFGARFQGFFKLLGENKKCFLLADRMKRCWREADFYEEFKKKDDKGKEDLMVRIEVSPANTIPITAERLSDQWQWNETGDFIRKLLSKEMAVG